MEVPQGSAANRNGSDHARFLVPIILGAGTFALFTLPTVSYEDSWGDQTQIGFSEARLVMTWIGYDWLLYVSALGVLTALAGALFLTPDSPQPRNLVMGFGALAALAFPFAFFFFPGDGSSLAEMLEIAGGGLFVYIVACVVGAVVGFMSETGVAASTQYVSSSYLPTGASTPPARGRSVRGNSAAPPD